MASTYLSKTFGSAGNRKKFTISTWVKRTGLGSVQQIMACGVYSSTQLDQLYFNDTDTLNFDNINTGGTATSTFVSNAKFRDTSAWYHIVVKVDSTQASAGDRVTFYVNGSEISLATETQPSQNFDFAFNNNVLHNIGTRPSQSHYFDGSMTHFHFTDGYAYDASTFGESDSVSSIWKPKTAPSVTYGTNGFFLKFENSGAMGTDSSGNSNTWSVGGGTLTQNVDTPSNNFATLNPLYTIEYKSAFFATNGLTTANITHSAWNTIPCTIAVSSGKWYFEGYGHTNGSNYLHYGITSQEKMNAHATQPENEIQANANGYAYGYYGSNGQMYYSTTSASTTTSYGNSYTSSDYIGIFMDLDNNKLYFAKNGTLQNSGTGFDIGADGKPYLACISLYSGATNVNFGSGVFGTTALTGTTYADANGHGIFKYSPNQGGSANFDSASKNFYAMNTKNLKEFG